MAGGKSGGGYDEDDYDDYYDDYEDEYDDVPVAPKPKVSMYLIN